MGPGIHQLIERDVRRPRHRGLALALVVGAVAMAVLEGVVIADLAGSWIWIDRLLWHPVTVEAITVTLVVSAFWLGLRSAKVAGAGTAVSVVIALPVLLVTGVTSSLDDSPAPVQRFPAPGGRWSAVVDHAGVHLMNDGSHVWIETHQGIRSRRWLAACLDADDPEDNLSAFTWEGPQQARIETLRGDVHILVLDATTGRPLTRIDVGPAAIQICG